MTDIYAMALSIMILTLGVVQVSLGVLVNLGWLKWGGIWIRSPVSNFIQGIGWICIGLRGTILEAAGMSKGWFGLEVIGFCLVITGIILDWRATA